MILQVIFLICAFVAAACIVTAVKEKVHNIGYIVMTVLVAVCDLICFRLLGCKSVTDARSVMTIYYMVHAWLFFAFAWMVMAISRRKNYMLFCIPTALICALQTVVMAGNMGRNRIMSLSRHIWFGGAWWVAEDSKGRSGTSTLMSFRAYRILLYVNILITLIIMFICYSHSAKVFRSRFYSLIVIHFLFTALELATSKFAFPVWIICLVINAICFVGLYYTCFYSNRKLRDWSLTKFANEMSDGFLLYNEFNELILVNDLLKYAFPPELIGSFASKANIDEWIEETITVENIEVRKIEFEGRTIYYKITKTELKDYDSDLGTIYILHDTSGSIQKIRAMEQANIELERAAKMKADFLANMSHEIRTPMNAVIGMAEIALREELPPHVEDYLMQIQNSGRNLLNIINDILDFSKIEAGKMEIVPEKYEPLSEINDIANVLATRIGDKNLELFVICDNTIPHVLEGDAMRIRQVLINLANNAIKFTKEGMVLVRITVEELSENMINLIFHVIDTGQGIKQEDLGKLFESFQQVDSKRNRSVEGTGLGLAISQRLCEAMDGKIGVTSEYGKGSDFYFNIPQRVIDPSHDLVVDQAEKKHAVVLNENPEMLGMFIDEMNKLGVDGKVIRSLSEFEPSGEIDFLFFEENIYDIRLKEFLDEHKDVIGVILVGFDSAFEADRSNLRIMRRPETTLSMVMTLNGKEFGHSISDAHSAFKFDFIAPEARILIVDDNVINITIAEGLMKPMQAQCIGVNSGRQALDLIENEDFDLILMDHMMPEMDGIETTRLIRSTLHKADNIPIIALTANAMEGVKEMFISEGMNDFVAKPIDIRDLVAKLKQWLPKEKMFDRDPEEESGAAAADGNETGTGSDTGIIADIGRLEEIDIDKAIMALGSPELYQTIVKEYVRSGKDKCAEIETAFANEDWPDYTIKVHALKSSSRQIGASELGAMAEELENAGKALDMDIIKGKTEETLNTFKELLNKLSPYFPEEEVDESQLSEIDDDELNRILDELLAACDDLDMDKMEECKESLKKHSYSDEVKEVLAQMYQAIDDIDVDTCVELAEKVREKGITN